MGLDITACGQIKYVEGRSTDDREDILYDQGCFIVYPNEEFINVADGLEEGLYRAHSEVYDFCAGSYSGYNDWRKLLCQAVYGVSDREFWQKIQQGEFAEGPFIELINFSDCEGVIGPITSKKLLYDFETHKESVMAKVASKVNQEEAEWFQAKYACWQTAFRIASDSGVVRFH